MQQPSSENIPDSFLRKWQEIADLLANIINVPAALIMKVENETMEVFTSSNTEKNPYNIGDKEHWHGLYCETVIKSQKKLNIPNALKDKDWDKNPDLKLGMNAYLGFPINFPDKTPFGTICVLDSKERDFTADHEKLLLQFKKVIELDLALIFSLKLKENSEDNEVIQQLLHSNEEYQVVNEEYLTTNEELQQANDELQQAKQRAEENEKKYRRIADNVTDVVWTTDLEMNPTYISPSVERVYGITPEEYLKRPLNQTYPPASIEKLKQTLAEQFAKEQDPEADKNRTFKLEVERYYSDGTLGWDAINATFIRDAQMNPVAIQGVSHDITKRKKAEEALRKSEATIRNKLNAIFEPEGNNETLNLADIVDTDELQAMMEDLFKTTKVGGAILDVCGKILVSTTMEDICAKFHRVHPDTAKNCMESDLALASGVPAGTFKAYRCKNNMWDMVSPIEIGGKHLGNIYIGQFFYEDEHINYELFRKQARQHGFDETEYMAALDRVPRLNRETVGSAMSFYAKFAEMIASLSYSKIRLSRDNEQRKKAEKALKDKNDLLQKVFDSNFDLVALTDLEGNFTLVGKSHEILGYDKDYLIGKNVMDFVHPDDIAKVGKDFSHFLKTGEDRMVEYRYKRSNGSYLWFETVGTILKDEQGNPEQILFNTRNISERKKSEEALRESEARFQKMLSVVPDMISIQNPEMDILYSNWQGFAAVPKSKQILNTKCHKTYRNFDDTCPDCLAKTVLETRKPVHEETRLPDGTWYDIRVIPILDENNNVEMFMEWVRDITASKQAEETLKSNYALLQIAGETARFGGWSVDLEKNEATWSDAVADIHEVPHGYAPPVEETINFYAPEWREKITQVFGDCAQKGIPYDEEMEIITAKRNRLWVRANGKAIKNETGIIIKVQGSFQDITERKKTEKALRESEEKMRSIYRVAPIGIGIVVNRVLKEVNPRVCHMTGYSREDLIGKNAQILYPSKKEYDFVGKEKYEQIRKKGTGKVETLWRKKDGTIINVLLASTPIDQNDHSKGVTFTALDITKRKNFENELKEKTAFLSTLMETSPVGIVTVDKSGNITYANTRAEQILGLVKDKITSLTYDAPLWKHTDLDGSPLPDEKQPFNIVKSSLNTVFDIQHGITWADGTVKILSINAAPIKDSDGQFSGMIASIEDISELKKTENALKDSAKLLQHWHELLNYIIKHNRSAVAVHDRDLNYVYVSQRYLDVFNVKDPDIIGKHHYEVFPDLPQKWREVHQKSLKGEIHSAEEDSFYHADGNIEWTRWECRPWYEADGSIGGIIIYTEVITERKQREQQLTEQKDLLAAIYRNAPLVMMVVNAERRVQQVNGFATQFVGRDAEEMLGLRGGEALRCMHALDDPRGCGFGKYCQQCKIRNTVLDTLETGKSHIQAEAPYFFKGNNNQIREMTFLTSTTAIKVKGERMVLVTLQDITERKQAEMIKQLQYNIAQATITTKNLHNLFDSIQNELNSFIDAKNFVIAFYNEETGMLSANVDKDEKDEIPEWPVKKSLTGYMIQQNRPVLVRKNEIMRLYKKGAIEIIGTISEVWLGVPLKIEDQILGAVVVQNYDNPDVYDQTSIEIMELVAHELSMFIDRQRSEEKINKLSRAIEQSSVSVIITDKEGTIEYVNPFFTDLTGYSFEEAKGKNPKILKSEHHSTAFYKELWDTIVSGNNWEGELLNKKKSGELYWEKAVISAIVNQDGVITNFVGIKEDITGKKKAEKLLQKNNEKIQAQNEEYESINEELRQTNEELYEAKEKAEESDRLKTAFLQNMSHEIRTPLNAISGFTGMLNKPNLREEKRKKFVSIIQNSSSQLVSIISDILTISSLDTEQEKVTVAEVDINSVIEELFSIFKPEAEKQNIALKVKTPLNSGHSVIYTDKTKITQIFTNLLSNALKFTHEGFVEMGYAVKTDNEPAEIEFYVKDSGIGMTPDQQKIIFDRFQQAHKSINKLYGGTGLGLSISKGFAEMLGGKIRVDSKPNEGSTFYFTIPFKTANKTDKATAPSEQKANSGTILVAEDEELNFVLIEEYLTSLNVNLIHAKDGQETVDICKKNPNINLILMDIKMPKITGDEAAKIIKELKPGLPIVAQSAYVQEHDIDRFSDIFDAYLAKPITEDVLKQTVSKYINMSKK